MPVGEWVVPIVSSLFNVINFVVFDIFLIALVYHLSADLSGRLNHASLEDGSVHEVILYCPPILGGGLCSTRRPRLYAMLLGRLLGLFLILASNLCVRGSTGSHVVRKQSEVRTAGSLRDFNRDSFSSALLLRESCQASNPDGSLFYGELRGPRGKEECVTDKELISNPPTFQSDIRNFLLSTGQCVPTKRKTIPGAAIRLPSIEAFECDYARLSCLTHGKRICRGVLRNSNETVVCRYETVRPFMSDEICECQEVKNIDWTLSYWMDSAFLDKYPVSILDGIHAMYGAGSETREVLVRETFPRTHISHMWAVVLALKLALVCILWISAVIMRRAGFRRVVNDERGLAELLGNGVLWVSDTATSKSVPESGSSGHSASIGRSVRGDIFLDAHVSMRPIVVHARCAPPESERTNEEAHMREEEFW